MNDTNEKTTSVERDESIDLSSLMKKKDVSSNEASPLDQMVAAKKDSDSGIVVDNKAEETSLRANNDTDEFREGVSEANATLISNAKKAEAVVVIKKPTNESEDAMLIDEIEESHFDDNGKIVVPENAKFIIPKYLVPDNKKDKVTKLSGSNSNIDAIITDDVPEESKTEDASPDDKEEKDNIVKVLIDKTGLGADIIITDDEQKIIDEANEIHVIEVEDKELATLKTKRVDENDLSFMDTIDKYQLSVSKTSMVYPISGFSADMAGLSYGEFADISLDTTSEDSSDEYDYNKNWKMMSVIYDKMTNISSGKFNDFVDFLKKFAYADLQLAIYALLISTEPEEDTISLRCHADNCGKGFIHKYAIRSLIDFSDATTDYLKAIDKVHDARGEGCFKVAENSPVRTIKKIRLPETNYIAEIGPASCYDFLYGICNQMGNLKEVKDEDAVIKKLYYILILNVVRAIHVKDVNGAYVRITNYENLTEIFDKYLTPEDFNILQSIYVKSIEEYRIGFSVKNIVCPHCGSKTESIDIDPRELVFRIQQTMRNTRLTLHNFQLF